MTENVIPPSPSWYCSSIIGSNTKGYFVFGTRHYVYTFGYEQCPPKFRGVYMGHKEKVTALSLCDHDDYVLFCASASEDGCVKLWNLENKELKYEHSIHSHKVTCISWSVVQNDLIVSGDEHGTIGVWQIDGNKQSAHRPEKGSILCLSSSPSTAALFAVGYKTGQINIVDVKRGCMIISRLRGHDEDVFSLSWCPVPGENFKPETTSDDITDLESFGVEDELPKNKKKLLDTDAGFGTDGWLLASGSKDKTIRVWSTSRSRQLSLLKLPSTGRRERNDESGKSRMWLTLLWSPHCSNHIMSGSMSGDILLWDITKSGKIKPKSFSGRGHLRFAFNLCLLGLEKKILCSVSMDRQIIFWDMDLHCQLGIMHTFGGYVYTIKPCTIDPGRIALGIGDNTIRLWNLNTSTEFYDITQYWQGIRAKVTALSWHPTKEGLLAYGTEDGRVGIYDTLSNKAPHISTTYHRRTVYVVTWGPPSISAVDEVNSSCHGYNVYSCGDGTILEHLPKQLDKEAYSINQLIQSSNPSYRAGTRIPTRSEISWSPDFTVVAVGNDDGTVEFYKCETFTLLAVVQVHHKLVNCVVWHPYITMATPNGSLYKHYVALGSNEHKVCVLDLRNMLDSCSSPQPLQTTESWRTLEGHKNRITGLAWNPHTDGMLLSVSYDGNAMVWNVADSQILACYQGHVSKILCCQWNALDPTEVITGGDDFTVHVWKYKDYPFKPELIEVKKKKKKKAKSIQSTETVVNTNTVETGTRVNTNTIETGTGISNSEQDMLEKLLEEKRQELEAKKTEDVEVQINGICQQTGGENNEADTDIITTTPPKQNKHDSIHSRTELSKKRPRKLKSLFPVYSKQESRGKKYTLEDIVMLTKLIYDDKLPAEYGPEIVHLGLFLDRRATLALLKLEGM
ncbi:Gem-associated protein 5 [Mactra antiquata]